MARTEGYYIISTFLRSHELTHTKTKSYQKTSKMPNLKGYGRKRKFLKRRRFTARARKSAGKSMDQRGSLNNPTVGYSTPLTARLPFPSHMRVVSIYSQPGTLTTGNSVFGSEQRFRLNSVYDPDYTGAGHTVRGYNILSGIYQQYRVTKCHYQVIFTTPGSANDIQCAITVAPNTGGSLGSANSYFPAEYAGGSFGVLSSAGERRCILQGTIDLAKLCGVTHTKYNADDVFSAYIGASPVQLALLSVATCCMDGTNGVTCAVQYTLSYETEWFDRLV